MGYQSGVVTLKLEYSQPHNIPDNNLAQTFKYSLNISPYNQLTLFQSPKLPKSLAKPSTQMNISICGEESTLIDIELWVRLVLFDALSSTQHSTAQNSTA